MISHNVTPWDMRTQSLSFPSEDSPDVLPPRVGHDSLGVRGIWIKNHLYSPSGPRSLTVGPSMGSTAAPGTLMIRDGKGWAPQVASNQVHECHWHLSPRSSLSQADPNRIPANGMPGPQSIYPANEPPNFTAISTKDLTLAIRNHHS